MFAWWGLGGGSAAILTHQESKSSGANEAYEYGAALPRVPWKSLKDSEIRCQGHLSPRTVSDGGTAPGAAHTTGIRHHPCRCDWVLQGEDARVF